MNQTRLESAIEVGANLVAGFWINFIANILVLPAFGFSALTLETNLYIGLAYTVISIARQYIFRRLFNGNIGKWVAGKLKRRVAQTQQ